MGLSSALAIAMSGLSANQAALSITSSNIANSQTTGYVAERTNTTEISSGGYGNSVEVTGVNRDLDLFVQSQLRTEMSGGAYADQMSNILNQLQSVYGTPGGQGTIETALSNFTAAMQAISTSSGSSSSQSAAVAAAQNCTVLEFDHPGYPVAAFERQRRYWQLRHASQCGDDDDRQYQQPAAGYEPE